MASSDYDTGSAREQIGLPRKRMFFESPPPRAVDIEQIRAMYGGELSEQLAQEVRELTLCFRDWAEADENALADTARARLVGWGEVATLERDAVFECLAEEAESTDGSPSVNRELVESAKSRLIHTPVKDPQAEAWLVETLARGVERLLKEEAVHQLRACEGPTQNTGNTVSASNDMTIATARSRPEVVVAQLIALGELDEIDARQALLYRLHFFGGRSIKEMCQLLEMDESVVTEELEIATVEVSVASREQE